MTADREATSSALAVKVGSAVPLTKDEQTSLRKKLEARFQQPLELLFEVEPSLLGGVVIRAGDQVLDGSVKGRLETLRQSLDPRR